jgi:hypothetical protein
LYSLFTFMPIVASSDPANTPIARQELHHPARHPFQDDDLSKEVQFVGDGAGGRNRTDTLSPEQDFESSASTSSATPAYRRREFARALHLFCT